ncbi:MAG: hypothetical protein EZS28_000401 [Streblomastix strix]|uniref:Uncharacterized protein n=1 Tax=Streblomastix strix TaxID=222440 RepID=A0A5J4XAB4_9EUKA|nr:MAG: hypothetical protein EZS28_000401 [Streblomastix strix]
MEQSGSQFAKQMLSSVESALSFCRLIGEEEDDYDVDEVNKKEELKEEQEDDDDDINEKTKPQKRKKAEIEPKKEMSEFQGIIKNLLESGSVEILKGIAKKNTGKFSGDQIAKNILTEYLPEVKQGQPLNPRKRARMSE